MATKRTSTKSGYVVEVGAPRSPGHPSYICDYARAPRGFARAVGLGELEHAQWFDDYKTAASFAFWQLGTVRNAIMKGAQIHLH